jgi:hypothetical protein
MQHLVGRYSFCFANRQRRAKCARVLAKQVIPEWVAEVVKPDAVDVSGVENRKIRRLNLLRFVEHHV